MTHELKCWPDFFTKIVHGEKTGDVRKNPDGCLVDRRSGSFDHYPPVQEVI